MEDCRAETLHTPYVILCEDPSGATAQTRATTTPLCVSLTCSPTRLHATVTRGAPINAVSTVTGAPSKHTERSSSGR